MMDLVKILYLILLMVILYYVTLRVFIVRKTLGQNEWLILLLIVGTSIVAYVRIIVHDLVIPEPSDEALYVLIIKDVINGMDPPVSGPCFVYLILFFKYMTGWSVDSITALFGLFVGSVFLLVLYFIYRKIGASLEDAILSSVFVLGTSYFLWPMIEARPQQLGMLLVLTGGSLYYLYMKKGEHLVPFLVICLLTFIFHILSFIVLGTLVLLMWWSYYLQDKGQMKKVIWPAMMLIAGMLIFISPFPLYSSMNGGVKWMLANSHIDFILKDYVIPLILSITVIISVLLTYYMKKKRVMERFLDLCRNNTVIIVPVFIVALFIILTVQFILNKDVHSSKYRGSLLLFLLMQAGNLVFGGLFLKGYFSYIRKGQFDDPYFRFVSILMFMGMISILFSLFLPINFNNWAIRIMNYWTLFAVPLVSREVIRMHPRLRLIIVLVLPLLIMVSLLNISRDQSIFGYP